MFCRVSPSIVLATVSCALVVIPARAEQTVDSPSPVAAAGSPAPTVPGASGETHAAVDARPAGDNPVPVHTAPFDSGVNGNDWAVRDRALAEAPGLVGLPGTYRAIDAAPGVPGQFRVGVFADWYRASFLCPGGQPCPSVTGGKAVSDSTTGHFGTTFALSFGLAEVGSGTLEGYAVTTATATSDTSGKPSLLQALGDTSLGFKYGARLSPSISLGTRVGIDLVNGAGSVGLEGAATGAHTGLLLSFDGRRLATPAPIRLHMNVGYTFDNRGSVVAPTETTRGVPVSRFERLGLGVNRTDHVDAALALEGLVADGRFAPFVEASTTILVNRQDYKCLRANPSADKCLADSMLAPTRLTIGMHAQPLANRAFSLLAAVDVGLAGSSDFIEEAMPIAPWAIGVGASWNFDARERPPVINVVEKVIDRGPKGTRVVGRGVDSVTSKPIGFARVHEVGHDVGPGFLAGADGQFRTEPVAAAQVELLVEADGYKASHCSIAFPPVPEGHAPAVEVAADCALEGLPAMLTVKGTLRDMETGAHMPGVAVNLKDSGSKSVTVTSDANGEFAFEGVMAGHFRMDAEPDGFLFAGVSSEGKARTEKTLDMYLRAKPKLSLVSLDKNEIAIKHQVQFVVNNAQILPESYGLLAEVADLIARTPALKRLEVQGHTDNAGAPDYNQTLSDNRAKAVRQWLLDHGIDANRLTAKGYGETKPLVPNLTATMKGKNRRVQFIITDGPGAR